MFKTDSEFMEFLRKNEKTNHEELFLFFNTEEGIAFLNKEKEDGVKGIPNWYYLLGSTVSDEITELQKLFYKLFDKINISGYEFLLLQDLEFKNIPQVIDKIDEKIIGENLIYFDMDGWNLIKNHKVLNYEKIAENFSLDGIGFKYIIDKKEMLNVLMDFLDLFNNKELYVKCFKKIEKELENNFISSYKIEDFPLKWFKIVAENWNDVIAVGDCFYLEDNNSAIEIKKHLKNENEKSFCQQLIKHNNNDMFLYLILTENINKQTLVELIENNDFKIQVKKELLEIKLSGLNDVNQTQKNKI